MIYKWKVVFGSFLISLAAGCSPEQEMAEPDTSPVVFDLVETPVGDVDFLVECGPEAARLVERGVALLHHMMYDEASFVFNMADDADPDCAMAYWGQAMTIINPLWPNTPSDEAFARGLQLVKTSIGIGGKTRREAAYLRTTEAYFMQGKGATEAERLRLFETAWRSLSDDYPDDVDAQSFFILASLATANLNDRTLTKQKQLGLKAESLLRSNANHPGAHHYLIHAYDYPELASRALSVADHYGEITPRIPHATHMMTHIYTRLGLWDKAIEWNDVSAEAALGLCLATGKTNNHYTHALDYLAYAHLQKGQDIEVRKILQTAQELQPPYSGNLHASAYAFAAIPARYALERRDWAAAADLVPRSPDNFPWSDKHDPYVAVTYFAKAMGAARSGRMAEVHGHIESLSNLRDTVALYSPYWAKQIDIQVITSEAWQLHALERHDDGLKAMRTAVALALTTEKHAITPGEALPTLELLGDMLFEQGRFDEAVTAYGRSLERAPSRLNSLYGSGKAAQLSGDVVTARAHFKQLTALAGSANSERTRVSEALAYLKDQE